MDLPRLRRVWALAAVLSTAAALTLPLAGCERAAGGGGSPGGGGPAARPEPPYPVFDGLTFEPSAAAYDPATDRYIVFSDKDFICYRYKLAGGRLGLPKDERHRALRLATGDAIMKIEGVTRLEDGWFLALTAFDRPDPDFRRLVRFRFGLRGNVECQPVAFPDAALDTRLRAIETGLAWWKLEGISTTAGDRAILVAVRSKGTSPADKDKTDVVWIARLPRLAGERDDGPAAYGPPERVIRFDAAKTLGRAEGASSLERDPADGSYWLLTSWEAGDARAADHGGHLFRLPAETLEGGGAAAAGAGDPAPVPLPEPVRAFDAKPEGLAVGPDGKLLVIFDDDTAWKRLFAGYEQSQALFLVLDAPGRGR